MHKTLVALITAAFACGSAFAKLPAPTPEAAAAAAATKDKAAWTDKVAAYKLCLAQDRVATHYQKTKSDAKKPTVDVPACADPGPYVPAVAAAPAPAAATPPAAAAPAPMQAAAPAKK
jgi:hypothetical protein